MKNQYRVGRRQVSFVVDEDLWVAVKCVAADAGVSVTGFVTGLLLSATSEVQQGSASPVVEEPVEYKRRDFDEILLAARAAKALARPGGSVKFERVVDPIEEIA